MAHRAGRVQLAKTVNSGHMTGSLKVQETERAVWVLDGKTDRAVQLTGFSSAFYSSVTTDLFSSLKFHIEASILLCFSYMARLILPETERLEKMPLRGEFKWEMTGRPVQTSKASRNRKAREGCRCVHQSGISHSASERKQPHPPIPTTPAPWFPTSAWISLPSYLFGQCCYNSLVDPKKGQLGWHGFGGHAYIYQ
jgi:hypothetical protein